VFIPAIPHHIGSPVKTEVEGDAPVGRAGRQGSKWTLLTGLPSNNAQLTGLGFLVLGIVAQKADLII
jgi:hypothetical protein